MTSTVLAETEMRAIVGERYGPPERLRLRKVSRPELSDDSVLVRVRAASVNPIDWHLMRGSPLIVRRYVGLRRPAQPVPGGDVAGTVEAVGRGVTEFAPGDEVFGSCSGTFAEYARGRERNFAAKPERLSFEQAAALAGAGVTALQAVRDHAQARSGTRLLINGAAGGVGTFAVQIAKTLGAHVTGVCSTRNLELVRSLGADEVIDYTVEDFTRRRGQYDVLIDNVGNRALLRLRRALVSDGRLVALAGGNGSWLLGWLYGGQARKRRVRRLNKFVDQTLIPFQANVTKEDMRALADLVASGKVTPIIDRTYRLEQAAEAIAYVEAGHAQGKVVVTVQP